MDYSMKICFWDGINTDQVKVSIFNDYNEIIEAETYTYGRDIGPLGGILPTAEDMVRNLIEDWGIESKNIYYSGYNVFLGKSFSKEQLARRMETFMEEV